MSRAALRVADIPLAAALILLFISLSNLSGEASGNSLLTIAAEGGELALPLAPDRLLCVPGPLGETVVEISGGKARIVESPCSGRQCVRTGWVEAGGGAAVCAPNRVAVRVGSGGGVDALLR